jgi:hypothetical protein
VLIQVRCTIRRVRSRRLWRVSCNIERLAIRGQACLILAMPFRMSSSEEDAEDYNDRSGKTTALRPTRNTTHAVRRRVPRSSSFVI